MSAITAGWIVSEGPAPMPLRMVAPMKLEYVVALARHIEDAKQMSWLKMSTGLRPQDVLMGTLSCTVSFPFHERPTCKSYQIKLLKPRTRMTTPVKSMTCRREISKRLSFVAGLNN